MLVLFGVGGGPSEVGGRAKRRMKAKLRAILAQ